MRRAGVVAGGLIHRFFGRSPQLPAEVVEALADLQRHAESRPTLSAPIALLRDVLPILYEEPPRDAVPQLSPQAASAKLAADTSLLRDENLQLDVAALQRQWQGICAAVQRHQNSEAGQALAAAVVQGRLSLDDLIRLVLAGRPEEIHAHADNLGLDAGLTTAVLGLALFPALSRINDALSELRQGTRWERGHCPTCGSWPLLGEFRGLEQTRFLRCGLCAAEWEFPRLQCPFCGERDHRQLGYLSVEGEDVRYRAATCDVCRGYVKMVSTLSRLGGPSLLVANVSTLHLDLAAADRGYVTPA
jgi:FdhE protein